MVPKVEFRPSPSPDVLMEGFDPTKFPAMRGTFPPELAALEPVSFVLTNTTDRKIVAIAVKWTATDASGHQRRITYRSDSFMSSSRPPVANPHSRLLVGPGAAQAEPLLGLPAIGPGVRSRSTYAKISQEASSVTVEVDCVIFEDGEIVGPNRLQFDSEIAARYDAAKKVAKLVRATRAEGKEPASALSPLVTRRAAQSDYLQVWTGRYAGEVLRAKDIDRGAAALEHMPEPPVFFHRTK